MTGTYSKVRGATGARNRGIFWAQVYFGACWEWIGIRDACGYGKFRVGNRTVGTHRLAWEMQNGPVPVGLELDHSCKNRSCCRPEHMRAVTHLENMKNADLKTNNHQARKTHCKHGHEFTPENTSNVKQRNGKHRARLCRTCISRQNKKQLAKRRLDKTSNESKVKE